MGEFRRPREGAVGHRWSVIWLEDDTFIGQRVITGLHRDLIVPEGCHIITADFTGSFLEGGGLGLGDVGIGLQIGSGGEGKI